MLAAKENKEEEEEEEEDEKEEEEQGLTSSVRALGMSASEGVPMTSKMTFSWSFLICRRMADDASGNHVRLRG